MNTQPVLFQLTEQDKIYLEETSKAVEERGERDAIFSQELEARRVRHLNICPQFILTVNPLAL